MWIYSLGIMNQQKEIIGDNTGNYYWIRQEPKVKSYKELIKKKEEYKDN